MVKARSGPAEQLRTAIADWIAAGRKRSNYALAKLAGVPEATIWRFRRAEQDLRLETAGKLLDAMELEVSLRKRARPARSKTPPPGQGTGTAADPHPTAADSAAQYPPLPGAGGAG